MKKSNKKKIKNKSAKKRVLSRALFLTVLSAAALMVTACGQSKSDSYAPMAAAAETAAAGAQANDNYSPEEKVENLSADSAASRGVGLTGSQGFTAEKAVVPTGRKLIRNVNMEVETDDFDALLTDINNRIVSLGGYVEQSTVNGRRAGFQAQPRPRSAFMSVRVPSGKLVSFVTAVEEAGNVVNKHEDTEDVTLKYSDIESRKKSLTVEQDRLWALLEKADTLESVIALEQRLSDIRYELESMESQLRLYDNQVDYSTVSLDICEVIEYTPTAPETVGQRISRGFSGTLTSLSDFLVNLFVLLVSLSPVWVPAVIIALIIYLFVRSRLRGKKGRIKENRPDKKKEPEDTKQP